MPQSDTKALTLCVRAIALCGGPVSTRAASRLADAFASKNKNDITAAMLERLGALPPSLTVPLPDIVARLLAGHDVPGLASVGGALETFGAAVTNAIGFKRLLGANKAQKHDERKPLPDDDNDHVLVIFVLGGITPAEIAKINHLLRASPTKRPVILASTDITTPDALAARIIRTTLTT